MSTTTTKRQWYKPALTDAPPNIVTATSFLDEMDDVGMFFYGTFAARPAATSANGHTAGCPGTAYYATDTNQLFLSAAGTWRQIPISGLAQILTGDLANNAVTAAKIEAQQAWQSLTFSGAGVVWSINSVQYYKDSLGIVHMSGRVNSDGVPSVSATFATLPVGFRPSVQGSWIVPAFDAAVALAPVTITTGGAMSLERGIAVGGKTWDFAAIQFRAA